MVGGTAGRTTLSGEGLQHQDGHSHLLAMSIPCVQAYDPAFAYELAVIVREGLKRMYLEGKDLIYYITVMNEKYRMPRMPKRKGIQEGIVRGMYKLKSSRNNEYNLNLLGSGTILNEVLRAADMLKKEYSIPADVWSVTSYKQLYDNARETERANRLKATEKTPTYIEECVGRDKGIFIAASDYVKAIPLTVSGWFPGSFTALGTDGYGLSEDRDHLRKRFEVNANHIVWAALTNLYKEKKLDKSLLDKVKKKLQINGNEPDPGNCKS
jgi:pyruvate dehydrogenase E1 component